MEGTFLTGTRRVRWCSIMGIAITRLPTMGARAILVWGNVLMTAANPLATRLTPAYLYPVSLHIGLGHRGNVGHISIAHSLMFESAPTPGQLSPATDTSMIGSVRSSEEGGFR